MLIALAYMMDLEAMHFGYREVSRLNNNEDPTTKLAAKAKAKAKTKFAAIKLAAWKRQKNKGIVFLHKES